jgi:hypothetical protein
MPRTESTKIGHARVCGGSGEATPRFYPARLENVPTPGGAVRKRKAPQFFSKRINPAPLRSQCKRIYGKSKQAAGHTPMRYRVKKPLTA